MIGAGRLRKKHVGAWFRVHAGLGDASREGDGLSFCPAPTHSQSILGVKLRAIYKDTINIIQLYPAVNECWQYTERSFWDERFDSVPEYSKP